MPNMRNSTFPCAKELRMYYMDTRQNYQHEKLCSQQHRNLVSFPTRIEVITPKYQIKWALNRKKRKQTESIDIFGYIYVVALHIGSPRKNYSTKHTQTEASLKMSTKVSVQCGRHVSHSFTYL